MKQLSDADNKKHKDSKYTKNDFVTFSRNLSSKADLQGWRNMLLHTYKNSNINSSVRFCDFGSGLGDKAYLLSTLVETKEAFCIDYSSVAIQKSKEFIKKDNFNFVISDASKSTEFIGKESLDLGLMFGFLHEVNNVSNMLKNVYPIFKKTGLLIISDNTLNFDYKALRKYLSESGYIFKIYKVKKFISTFNLGNVMFINYKKHPNRTDKLLAVCSINSINDIKSFLKCLKKAYS